jgi:hypothetical protein
MYHMTRQSGPLSKGPFTFVIIIAVDKNLRVYCLKRLDNCRQSLLRSLVQKLLICAYVPTTKTKVHEYAKSNARGVFINQPRVNVTHVLQQFDLFSIW